MNCAIPNAANKAGCCAMTDGYCTVCPKSCHWGQHFNDPHQIVYGTKKKVQMFSDLKAKYDKGRQEKNVFERVLAGLEEDLTRAEIRAQQCIRQMRRSRNRLAEIAFRPDPLSDTQYIDQLIAVEERMAKPGYKQRVKALDKLKKQAAAYDEVFSLDANGNPVADIIAKRVKRRAGTVKRTSRSAAKSKDGLFGLGFLGL